jgi:predicted dehydrogenase
MNVATIGTGVIVDRMIDAISRTEGMNLYGVYSRSMAKAQNFAAKHGAQKAWDDLDAMLADENVDIVYVASPNSLHYDQTKKALEAGKHVINEKPFASTLAQAKDLFDTAENNGVYVFEAITGQHVPNYEIVRNHLPELGPIAGVYCSYCQFSSKYPAFLDGSLPNVFNPDYDGGALMDINVYNIHFITGLFGKPEKVTYYPRKAANGIDTSGTLILEYPGFHAIAVGAKDSAAPAFASIQGEKGTLQSTQASTGLVSNVKFLPLKGDMIGKKDEDLSVNLGMEQGPHMDYECQDFVRIITEKDQEEYDRLKAQTLLVCDILEEAKRQRDS